MTGGRLKRVSQYIKDETFCLTYGDGVSDVDISASIAFHRQQKTLVTLTAVQQSGRFGIFTLGDESTTIQSFREKPKGDGVDNAWVNGGFFVVEPQALDYISNDQTIWEKEPLEQLAEIGQLSAFKHLGFWHPMDTLRDKQVLENLYDTKKAPWKIW